MIDGETDTVTAATGMGGMVKGRVANAKNGQMVSCKFSVRSLSSVCHSKPFNAPLVDSDFFLQMECHYSIQHLSPLLFTSYGSTPFTSYSWHLRLPQLCLEDRRLLHQCKILFPFSTSSIPLIVTALWYQPDGKISILGEGFDTKS